MAVLISRGRAHSVRGLYRLGPARPALLLVRLTTVVVILHILQVVVWCVFYRWKWFSTWESACYFSTGEYSTVGSGDLLLPPIWRLLGGVEAVTGVRMWGVSASFLFAMVLRLVERYERFSPELVWPS
jgi:voltage-gated potassium channel